MDNILKIVFIGEANVGKTSIIRRAACKEFSSRPLPSTSIEFSTVDIPGTHFQVWDCPGDEGFLSQQQRYINDSDGIVLVYDVQHRQTFINIVKYLDRVVAELKQDKFLVIVGNKSDPGITENVYYEEGYLRAKQANAMFIETSAMADENILELFEGIASAQRSRFSKKFYDL